VESEEFEAPIEELIEEQADPGEEERIAEEPPEGEPMAEDLPAEDLMAEDLPEEPEVEIGPLIAEPEPGAPAAEPPPPPLTAPVSPSAGVPARPPTPAPAPGKSGNSEAGLLDYLSDLTRSLPDQKRSEFLSSDVRLKLEYLKSRLRGEPGLKRDVERFAPAAPPASSVALTPKRLTDTLTYISTMSGFHPDAGIGMALKSRVAVVLERIRQLKEGSL
jgi:hypothetical protein